MKTSSDEGTLKRAWQGFFHCFGIFWSRRRFSNGKIFSYIFFLSSWWSLDGTELNTRSKKLKLRPQRSPSRTILTFLTDSKCLDSYMSRCCSCRFSKDRSKVAKTLKFGEKKIAAARVIVTTAMFARQKFLLRACCHDATGWKMVAARISTKNDQLKVFNVRKLKDFYAEYHWRHL